MVAHRGEGCALTQVPCVVHSTMAGGVDLDDIQAARATAGKLYAAGALAARCSCWTLRAVQAARQDACRRGLAATARTGKEISVVDAIFPQGGHERFGDVFLPDDIRESLWAISAVKGCTHDKNPNGWH
ncbi:hypothetical protein GCM10009611_02930 [Arthrobacter roseus]